MRKGYPLTAEELLLDPNRLRCPQLWALGKTAEQASLWLDNMTGTIHVREEKLCAQALPTVHWQTLMVLQSPGALHEGAGVGVPYQMVPRSSSPWPKSPPPSAQDESSAVL